MAMLMGPVPVAEQQAPNIEVVDVEEEDPREEQKQDGQNLLGKRAKLSDTDEEEDD